MLRLKIVDNKGNDIEVDELTTAGKEQMKSETIKLLEELV